MGRIVYFGGDDQITSPPAKLLDCLSHDNFGLSTGIAKLWSVGGFVASRYMGVYTPLCSVEKVDTTIIGLLHAIECDLCHR